MVFCKRVSCCDSVTGKRKEEGSRERAQDGKKTLDPWREKQIITGKKKKKRRNIIEKKIHHKLLLGGVMWKGGVRPWGRKGGYDLEHGGRGAKIRGSPVFLARIHGPPWGSGHRQKKVGPERMEWQSSAGLVHRRCGYMINGNERGNWWAYIFGYRLPSSGNQRPLKCPYKGWEKVFKWKKGAQ